MARVRMKVTISGGRQLDLENNAYAEWPRWGEILECSEEEAAHLVRGGMADPVEDVPLPAAAPVATPAAPVRTETPAGDEPQATSGTAARRTAARPADAPKARAMTARAKERYGDALAALAEHDE